MRKRTNINEIDIIPAFRDSIFRDSTDVLMEYEELAIDIVLDQELF